MAGPQNYIDNLENLRLVMSVALEHTQKNRDQFLKNSTGEQVRQAERLISKGRGLAEQLEKEFDALESLITKARSSPGDPSVSS
jgi:electron transfer flavoprotein alpha subunit